MTTNWMNVLPGTWTTENTPVSGFSFAQAVHSLNQVQAAQTTPQSPSTWEEKPGSHYFETTEHAAVFADRRHQSKMYNQTHGLSPIWSEHKEHKLVDQLWRGWFDEPWPGVQVWTQDELNLDALPTQSLRKYKLQPFKINYETYQEIKLRLYNTVISVKGNPFWVKAVGQDGVGKFKLLLTDVDKQYQVKYDDLNDLRTIPPMYVTSSSTGWLARHPGRVYQQGMNRNNTSIRSPDCEAMVASFDPVSFINGFKKRQNREWSPVFANLLSTGELANIRLSDDVAIQHKRNKVIACYRGRALGEVVENEVNLFDEDDALQQWIETAARKVNLELRAK